MDKNAIKKYAIWARNELIGKVRQKAQQFGIEDGKAMDPNAESVNGTLLTDVQKTQRKALIKKIDQDGFSQVMEEVAYTWFNRFIALRFMEVNGYLPSHVRVFTDENNNFKPQILSEALHLELDGLDTEKVYAMKEANQDEYLFKYLLIVQCNALNAILPGMFQKIADYTELLLPDYLLREGSVIEQMIAMIPEEDWTDQVQIIGWLYQYYNTEPKDQVFADLKKNKKITKEKIPAATQLFTPDWIVRYMVENSLGRLWLEGHPTNKDKFLPTKDEQDQYIQTHEDDGKWHYYLEEAKQEPDVQKQLNEIRREYSDLKPEDILCIDPCMGSGHIICYLFDMMVKIYEDYGYSARDAAASIVQNNLWGLDIDERASQLAYFAVMMKARQYDRRFFTRGVQPHVYAIAESNHLDKDAVKYFEDGDPKLKKDMDTLISELHDAKEYGSILTVSQVDFAALNQRIDECADEISMFHDMVQNDIAPLIHVGQALAQKYHVVVTNPPYMGNAGFSIKLADYAKNNFKNSKNDLYSIMIEKCGKMTRNNYFSALITMQSWINAPTFKNLRRSLFSNYCFPLVVNMGSRAFEEISGEKVKNVAFVFCNRKNPEWKPTFIDLTGINGENEKRLLFLKHENRFDFVSQNNFLKDKQCLVIYKTKHVNEIYSFKTISDYAEIRRCIATGNDERFLRLWFEIDNNKISSVNQKDEYAKWFFVANGGERRRWFGNISNVIDWENDGERLKEFNEKTKKSTLRNVQYMFKEGVTYTYTSMGSGVFNARSLMAGMASIGVGPVIVDCHDNLYMLALVNSAPFRWFWDMMYGKVSTFETGNVGRIPYIEKNDSTIRRISNDCVNLAQIDWNSFETSWKFQKHPVIRNTKTIEEAFLEWQIECDNRFNQLKSNEEELNRIFIDIYGLQGELSPEEEDKDVTVRKADLSRDIRSFISYAVGCMFGRYSLDVDGLAYAGGNWDASKYTTFIPDKDNIIPICDDEYFSDDIVGRFVKFVEAVYGADTLEENLKFIADALSGKGTPREVIRNYFLNDFYKDHCKTYQKRPIYWLFDSGKKNGFKCLIYMHRYQPDTIARIRTDYVHEQQSRYRTAIEETEERLLSANGSAKVQLSKKLKKLQDQDTELHAYEEKIHHLADQMISIDLDDGVKHNYAIFQDVLAKIK